MTVELSSAKYFQETESPEPIQQAPIQPQQAVQSRPKKATIAWTGRLTLICILCIVMGGFGFLFGALGVLGTLSGPPKIQSGHGSSIVMQKKMMAVQKKFVVPQLFNSMVKMGAGAMLVLAGFLMFGRKRNSRSFGQNACFAAIASHVLTAAIGSYSVIVMSGVMRESMAGQVRADQMDMAMGVFSFGGVIFILGALVFFAAVYGSMAIHLSSPNVRRIFGENPYPEKEDMQRRAAQCQPAAS